MIKDLDKDHVCFEYEFEPHNICCKRMFVEISEPDNVIHNTGFVGGCNGNLEAISMLIEGMKADDFVDMFDGHLCGKKGTSCMDQLAKFLKENVLCEEENDN